MAGKDIKIRASGVQDRTERGGEFDCYLAIPVAPPELLEAYRPIPARMKNFELHVFPGILHGYMMRGHKNVFDAKTREFSMGRARAILEGLRS